MRTQTIDKLANGEFRLRDVRRMQETAAIDPASVGVTLIGPTTWDDGEPVKLCWVHVAHSGVWEGHSSGPFQLDEAVFLECVANFDRRGVALMWDAEHKSEEDSDGSAPIPAQGWIHQLRVRDGGLYALTEWLSDARSLIKTGKVAHCSPAIRLGCKDGVTGKPIGARLTSVAIVSAPFLTDLEQLVAASDRVPDAEIEIRLRDFEGRTARAELLLAERDRTVAAQGEELRTLREDKVRRDEEDLAAEVDAAFRTYKDLKKLTDADRPRLLAFGRHARSEFREMYPRVALENQFLLRALVPPEPKPKVVPPTPIPSESELVNRLMRAEGLNHTEATIQARQVIAAARARARARADDEGLG